MTDLSAGVRYLLRQDAVLTAMLVSSTKWGSWIFEDELKGPVENTQKCAIVLSEGNPWSPPGANTQTFPTIVIDVWADPKRNTDNSVFQQDAKSKIKYVGNQIRRNLHILDFPPPNNPTWGTPDQIAEGHGVIIFGSQQLSGPIMSPVTDGNGMWLGSYTYGISLSE